MRRRYHSLRQISEAGRWAWASSGGGATPDLYYDGADFWFDSPGKGHVFADGDALPQHGWWHATNCACDLCRSDG